MQVYIASGSRRPDEKEYETERWKLLTFLHKAGRISCVCQLRSIDDHLVVKVQDSGPSKGTAGNVSVIDEMAIMAARRGWKAKRSCTEKQSEHRTPFLACFCLGIRAQMEGSIRIP